MESFSQELMSNAKLLGALTDDLAQTRHQLNEFTDLDSMLKRSKDLAHRIEKQCYLIVAFADKHWDDKLQRLMTRCNAYQPLASSTGSEGIDRFFQVSSQVLRDNAHFLLETNELMYKVSLAKTGMALQKLDVVTSADLKEFGITAAEWTTTAALDFVPGSGIGTKLLKLAFEKIGGVDIEDKLWNGWTVPVKRQKLAQLCETSLRKAEIVVNGFLGFYVLQLLKSVQSLEKAMEVEAPSTKAS